jgi:DNA adenine methylase
MPHYCEPFGGSGVVLLNRRPAEIETFNDLNGRIVNFFRVLRTQSADLIQALEYTPYARAEFLESRETCEDALEEARRFFISIQMDIAKGGRKSLSMVRWCTLYNFFHGSKKTVKQICIVL